MAATLRNPFKATLGEYFLAQLHLYHAQGPYYVAPAAAEVRVA